MIRVIKTGEYCKISLITADTALKKGGKYLVYEKCRIARLKLMLENNSETTASSGIVRSPNHNVNFTINVEFENGQVRSVHPLLIMYLNDERIL